MKKIFLMLVLVILLGASAMPVLAHAQEQGVDPQAPLQVFGLTGRISALDASARTLTVKVWGGNWLAKPFKGQSVTLQVTEYTRFFEKQSDCTLVPVTFQDLQVGQRISATGRLVGETWRLWRLTIRPVECCCQ